MPGIIFSYGYIAPFGATNGWLSRRPVLEVHHFRGPLLELKDTGCGGQLSDPVEK